MAIKTWGRSRKRVITHAQHPTLRRSTLCGCASLQKLDPTKYLDNIDCKRCRVIFAKMRS